MTFVGSLTFIKSAGLSSNADLVLNAATISNDINVHTQKDFIPTKAVMPNSEVDYIGVENRRLSVTGHIDLINPQPYAGLTCISVSGLHELAKCKDYDIWLGDEGVFDNGSGCWVKPERINISRSLEAMKSESLKGYVIRYNISFIETEKIGGGV